MSIAVKTAAGNNILGHVELSARTGGKVTLAGFSEVLGHLGRNVHGDGWTAQDMVGHTEWTRTRMEALRWLWERRELILRDKMATERGQQSTWTAEHRELWSALTQVREEAVSQSSMATTAEYEQDPGKLAGAVSRLVRLGQIAENIIERMGGHSGLYWLQDIQAMTSRAAHITI